MKTFYEILGVKKEADTKEIKSAYRKLVKQFHPDVAKNGTGATKIFEEISKAYTVLSNVEKRKEYDSSQEAKKQILPKLKFQFREFRNWLFSINILKMILSLKKIVKHTPAIDPSILEISVDELLKRILYSRNIFVQVNAVKALIAKNKRYAVNDLLRILYSGIDDTVKIEIIEGLKNCPEKRIKEVIREIYDVEKSLRVRQAIRQVVKVA